VDLGSVLHQSGDLDDIFERSRAPELTKEARLEILRELQLRFFSPREISRLMGFGDKLLFPSDMTLTQKYRCLGNSINVDVVAFLLNILFANT
jgi:tRNA (cytosine38-C5)-methyltransferase